MTAGIRSTRKAKGKHSTWFICLELIFVVSLVSNMVIYGGIPSLAKIGPALEKSVAKQSQLHHLYMRAGEWLMPVPGLKTTSHQILTKALGPQGVKDVAEDPGSAGLMIADRSYNSFHSFLHTLAWFTPFAFVMCLIGLWFRPKQVKSFG